MTAVDLDALDKLRGALAVVIFRNGAGNYGEDAADALLAGPLADLIAEARKYRALREAVEGLCATVDGEKIPHRFLHADAIREVVAAVDEP